MSWTADIIYTIPNESILYELRSNSKFMEEYALYIINDLNGIRSKWTMELMTNPNSKNKTLKHEIPSNGILVVRPRIYKTGYNNDYSEYNFWNSLNLNLESNKELELIANTLREIVQYKIQDNQIKKLYFVDQLSKKYNHPFVYYRCDTWGGSKEFEFGLTFGSSIKLYNNDYYERCCHKYEKGNKAINSKSVLRECLSDVNVELPTDFFALHETSFDWSIYEV